MIKIIFAVFVVLHGLVHLLYLGQSARTFELQPGMTWPDGALLFGQLFEPRTTRQLASIGLLVAAIGFAAGGVGLLTQQAWWRSLLIGAGAFSSLVYLLCWDGAWQKLADKGLVGILINLALVVLALVWRPSW